MDRLEQQALDCLQERKLALLSYSDPSPLRSFQDDPSVMDPSRLDPPLRSAVKALLESLPLDDPDRKILRLFEKSWA